MHPFQCREHQVSMSVTENPERYSLISVPFPFIVPGGRFREMYYWDSFFTIKGLLASKMFETTKGMMYNMKHLIDLFGFVPNGNRVYYLNRSQPPLLTWCVYEYWKATGDATFVAEILPTLRKEMDFFDRNRRVQCEGWPTALYRYQVVVTGPRPESFREDEECAAHIQDEEGKRRLWGDIAAAAESGRDFSCRWLLDHIQTGDLTVKGMATTRTSELVPVDLNAIMCGNMKMLSELYAVVGDVQESHWAMEKFNLLKEAIHQVLWNEEEGCWFDFDLKKKEHVDAFFDTNLFPLYTHSFHQDLNAASVLKYLEKVNVLSFPGGLPSSLVRSGQQWDFPNGWAPTTWIVIQGLLNIRLDEVAFKLADKWIRKNYAMWCNSGGKMFEKYDVEDGCDEGKAATGGEFSKGR